MDELDEGRLAPRYVKTVDDAGTEKTYRVERLLDVQPIPVGERERLDQELSVRVLAYSEELDETLEFTLGAPADPFDPTRVDWVRFLI